MMPDATLNWNDVQGRRVTVPGHVVHRNFVSETVLLNIETGYYHGMDEVGGRFFEVLGESETVAAAADALAGEYEQPVDRIQADLLRFCAELHSLGLIQLPAPGR
jgi:hypothetical protein